MVSHTEKVRRNNAAKVQLFRDRFSGLQNVYGTYDPASKKAFQVKAPVTDAVLLAHLTGKQPYGVYLLTGENTRAVVADFDDVDLQPPLDFIAAARHYGLPCYLETSKSKGYHVWCFLDGNGVSAAKARAVFRHILDEIEKPTTEVFPKQDSIAASSTSHGNFLFSPLFGELVPKGRTVFINLDDGSMQPYPNQWDLLENVALVAEPLLDQIIDANDIPVGKSPLQDEKTSLGVFRPLPGALPPCTRRMLEKGVTANQRVSCFRLAVHLRKVGLPYDLAAAVLLEWSRKNRPSDGKTRITGKEVQAQTATAYLKEYHGCGCEEPAIRSFCDPSCPVFFTTSGDRSKNSCQTPSTLDAAESDARLP